MRFRNWLIGGAGVLLFGVGVSLAAQGTRPQEPDVLSALLAEVRGLRQAMEQMVSAGPRVQLALGRLQLQEQRVNGMIRRLESVRDSISKAEKENEQVKAQLASFETMFKASGGDVKPGETNPMEGMLVGFRNAAAGGEADIQRLQAEEAQIQQQIAAEQGRWAEINRALEDLERAMAKR
jgi:chromosome segregation ATPase